MVVDDRLETGDPDIHAIGEVAQHRGMVYGLVAPGYEMAEALAARLGDDTTRVFTGADLSTKLKLTGVDVASFGDYDAGADAAKPLTYEDPFGGVYKKLLFSPDGKKLVGGILVGDASDYGSLMMLAKNRTDLPAEPGALVLGSGAGGVAVSATEMPAETQVCQCNGVSKGDICAAIRDDGCAVVGDVKARTRAGTGCGGCLPLVTDLLKQELEAAGRKVSTDLCEHFPYTRQELLDIVKVREIKTFAALIAECGRGHGCEICKPAVSSMFASLWNENILDDAHQTLQDTNDRFLANMQRGGVYSVIPRVPGGEITPDKLIALGAVAKKYCARCARRRAGAGSTWGASPTSPPTAAPPSGTAGPRSRCSTSRRAASGTPPRTCAPTSRRSSSPAASSATRRGPPRSPAPSTRRSSGSTPARVSAGRATS